MTYNRYKNLSPFSGWPDILVAAIMGVLSLQGAMQVMGRAIGELRHTPLAIESAR